MRKTSIPRSYVTVDGFRLGQWVTTQRSTRESLEPERQTRLEALKGWSWDPQTQKWEDGFAHLEAYALAKGDSLVPQSYVTDCGYRLGQWVGEQRTTYERLSIDCKQQLEALPGWAWNANDALWEAGVARLEVFVATTGHARVIQSYKSADGYSLGKWVNSQRVQHSQGALRTDRVARLEAIDGWVWRKPIGPKTVTTN